MENLTIALREFAEKILTAKDWLDLQAQQDMAFWAKWMFWATIGGLVISAFALIGAAISLWLARLAMRDTRRLGEFQAQAYVHASTMHLGSNNNIIIKCKNSGLTPCIRFSVNAIAQIVKLGNVESSLKFPVDGFKRWSAIGANEDIPVNILDDSDEIKRFKKIMVDEGDVLSISGTIKYATIFQKEYSTQFAFYLAKKPSSNFRKPTSNLTTFQETKVMSPKGLRSQKSWLKPLFFAAIGASVGLLICCWWR